ncbi:MAG TPA: cyanophycinase [Acidobacteriota bacterium]|nr:cyanophycinase [Acidobacteriota bacterium]
MKKRLIIPALMVLLAGFVVPACSPKTPAATGPKGHLFIIGGGERDEPLMRRFIALAQAFDAGKIVVFTMATSVPDEVRQSTLAEYERYGVKDVAVYHLTREEALKPDAPKILDGAGGVFFTGGDQARITAVLLGTPVLTRLREIYAKGGIIGGTSAGAAIQSELMITGDEKRTKNEDELWQVIMADDVIHTEGLGFVKNAVIDQHFVARRRSNRLVAVVLENPSLIGVGIDESTAVLVRPDGKYEVLGESQVLIYDARHAKTAKRSDGRLGGHGLTMQVLLPGDVYDPATGRVEEPSK